MPDNGSRRTCPRSGPARLSPYGGAWRSAMRGFGGVASDNRQDSNHPRLGASAEGRLAWPQASSPSGHFCKPARPPHPPVAPHRTPVGINPFKKGSDPFSIER
jgi:hypothetical protein